MKFRLIQTGMAVATLLIASVSAHAADLPAPSYKAPAYTAPSYYSWSGFYVGAFGGYGFGESTFSAPATTVEPEGFLAGGTIGYNYQTGTWVWGIEGDIAYSDMSETLGGVTTDLNWLATVRGRIGYAGWSNFLVYITGGAAFGDIEATTPAGSGSDTAIGWTLGAGLEYAIYSNWSLKLEYLYVDLGSIDCDACVAGPAVSEVDFTAHTIKAGLNYRF